VQEQPRKKARLNRADKDTVKSTLSRTGAKKTHQPPKKKPASRQRVSNTSRTDRKGDYGISTCHFYLWCDGMEYPVTVQQPNRNKTLKSNERIIRFERYGQLRKATISQLLPATRKREAQ